MILQTIISLILSLEDYKCKEEAGCKAITSENGELVEEVFRKGDIISTEDGWIVSPDDGWEKIPHQLLPPDLSLINAFTAVEYDDFILIYYQEEPWALILEL